MSGSLLSQSNSVLIFSSGSVCCFFKTCLWFLNVLIDAVKTSVQITEPRGSYLKERWQKNVSVHGTAQRDLLFLFFAQELAAGRAARRGLCSAGAVLRWAPARARGAVRDEIGSLGEKNGCERDGLDVSAWPVAWIITVTAIQNTFLWRKGGQSCVTLSASESRQGCCDQCCKLADT